MHSFSLFATTSPSQSAFIIADTTGRRRCHKRRRRIPIPNVSSSTINEREGKPIQPGQSYPAKEHCSNCGLCDSSLISYVKDACAFLGPGMSRIEKLEEKVHGKKRNTETDELRLGVLLHSIPKITRITALNRFFTQKRNNQWRKRSGLESLRRLRWKC